MNLLAVTLCLSLPGEESPTPQAVARMQSGALTVGEPLEFVIRIEGAPVAGPEDDLAPIWWGDPRDIGVARPILHIDPPEGLRLLGMPPTELKTPLDFETDHLEFPYGRKMFEEETHIAFELSETPEKGTTVAVNVTFWLDNEDPDRARFVRQRIELALEADAVSLLGDASNTSWGEGKTLSIGDTSDFNLPTHDDYQVALEDYRGTPLLLATYRAHW